MPSQEALEERIAYLESVVAKLPARFPAPPQVPRVRRIVRLEDHLYYGIVTEAYGVIQQVTDGGLAPSDNESTVQVLPGFVNGFSFSDDYIEVELWPQGWVRMTPGAHRAQGTLGSSLTVGSSVSVTVRGSKSIDVYGWLGDVGNGKKISAIWDDYLHQWYADNAAC